MKDNYCKNCMYWSIWSRQYDHFNRGICKRFPPGTTVHQTTETFLCFTETKSHTKHSQPVTTEYDQCGEFKPSEQDEKKQF